MDWQIGDLALCISIPVPDKDGVFPWKVQVGCVYTVIDVVIDCLGMTLNFAEDTYYSPLAGFDANCFRKIRPDEHQPCEEEFVTLLNRAKRPVSA